MNTFNGSNSTPREWAKTYINEGFSPIPVPYKAKGPITKDWKDLKVTMDTVANWFGDNLGNIGIILGAASGELVDADLDCDEAVRLAHHFLPGTRTFGRASRPSSHRLYRAKGAKVLKFTDVNGSGGAPKTLLELRAEALQTVFPGSTHPSGEKVQFENELPIMEIEAAELRVHMVRLAVATLLVRHGWSEVEAVALACEAEARLGELPDDLRDKVGAYLGLEESEETRVSGPRPDRPMTGFQAAVDAYNAANPLSFAGRSRRCPACDHHGCFGKLGDSATRWACFSTGHGETGVGLEGAGCWHGDQLDLDAFEAGMERRDLLRREGFLVDDDACELEEPEPEAVVDAGVVQRPLGQGTVPEHLIRIGDAMPPEVGDLVARHVRLQTLLDGTGKPACDAAGQRLPATPEGYDAGFLMMLVKKGVEDPSTLATALARRPDRHALLRGAEYIREKVLAALARVNEGEDGGAAALQLSTPVAPAPGGAALSTAGAAPTTPASPALPGGAGAHLGVQQVRIFTGETPRHELQIGGVWHKFSTDHLLNPSGFRKRYFECTQLFAQLPKGKNASLKWERIVAAWMKAATIIDLPAEGTTDGALHEAVKRAVDELIHGDSIEDLDDGKGFVVHGKVLFKTAAISRKVNIMLEKVRVDDISRHLKNLGLAYKTQRHGPGPKDTVKAWAAKLKNQPVNPAPAASPSAPPPWPTPAPAVAYEATGQTEPATESPSSDNPDFGAEVTP
ncbi:MAG: bifunctional DNA primase/polymerase [Deltaproteobacteria bacterium]|nr:bifunctional DNA primase/polymerase [Deltaproteobacteria bacterium]